MWLCIHEKAPMQWERELKNKVGDLFLIVWTQNEWSDNLVKRFQTNAKKKQKGKPILPLQMDICMCGKNDTKKTENELLNCLHLNYSTFLSREIITHHSSFLYLPWVAKSTYRWLVSAFAVSSKYPLYFGLNINLPHLTPLMHTNKTKTNLLVPLFFWFRSMEDHLELVWEAYALHSLG